MSGHIIEYYNRYTGKVEQEQVYGESFLRFIYGNPLGKLSLHGLVKRSLFSKWYGSRMDHPGSRGKVLPFIQDYKVDPQEFLDSADHFRSFNEFFYRKLKPGARPIFQNEDAAVFPADGRHLGFESIDQAKGIFVKGAVFTLEKLFKDSALARQFKNGSLILSRLCPVDYHRYHFPVNGTPGQSKLIPGPLFSVNPLALRQNIEILTQNKRSYCLIDSPEFGKVAMFEIGATCVGSFEYTYLPNVPMKRGSEKGFFKFGGSSTITIFEQGRIQLAADLLENSLEHRETYAKVGDCMGYKR
ncbi:MAG: archaetidylserine decarboxylase [Verrucomicrobiales bacterium]